MPSLKELSEIAAKASAKKDATEKQVEDLLQKGEARKRQRKIKQLIALIKPQMLEAAEDGDDGVAVLSMCDNIDGLNDADRKHHEEWDEPVYDAVFEYCQKQGWKPEKYTSEYYGDSGIFTHSIIINWGESES